MTDINLEKDYISSCRVNLSNDTDIVVSAVNDDVENEQSIFDSDCNTDASVQSLKDELKAVEDEQGVIGKAWNGIKNFFGFGNNSNKVEDKIKAYENGEISYEEALASIQKFDSKQEGAVNLISNIVTGVATAGFAVATGGVGAIVGGALIGGAAKAGLKTFDRATNNIEGDALDGKQILKDGLVGAVDGTVSALTAGMIKTPLAGQSIKQAVKQGVISGAKAGAISGATTGACEYTVEAAFEDDVEFKFDNMLKTSAQNAVMGGIFGGLLGGVTGGIGQKSLNNRYAEQSLDYLHNYNINNPKNAVTNFGEQADILGNFDELTTTAAALNVKYASQLDETTDQIRKVFSNEADIVNLSSRIKSQDSAFKKLAKKTMDGKLTSTDFDSCFAQIGDGVGFRIQTKSLSVDDSTKIVDDILAKNGIKGSYDDFVRYVNGESIDSSLAASFDNVRGDILDSLKSAQTQGVVNQLVDGIKTGKINISELNNYGDGITSYFTKKQIQEIVDAYDVAVTSGVIKPDNAFKIVNKDFALDNNLKVLDDGSSTSTIIHDDGTDLVIKQKTKGAIKDSGYSSSQMNTKHVLEDGSIAYGELQIRGDKLNDFADVEHIPYDIRTGKIFASDKRYSDIYDVIRGLSKEDYAKYNTYLSDVYKTLRLQELGLLSDCAVLPNLSDYLTSVDGSIISKLDYQGLVTISKRHS